MAKNEIGVTYLGLLFAVALGSIALAGTGALWQMESRRDKEKELLFIGEEYRRAIASYYDNSPADPQYPARLADLVLDPRFPMPVRHLRRLYSDPLSSDGQWQLISRQGRIVGIASRSLQAPIKIGDFPAGQADFAGASRYADWQFVHKGGASRRRISADENDR
ncbi:type II secretion system protein [Dechloromonas hortensis]|uniref:type II secretion system protein n=1 Tax=Dechloromonas hortensis TaxID=337779 RepID=UPI001291A6B7|nr:type II secretion system protein [Dechloromonas hortensis]